MRSISLIGLAILGLAATLLSARALPDRPVSTQIDAIFSSRIQAGEPGVAVLVQKDGRILFEVGYGVRDLRTHSKIDSETNFRLASFTKQFTAMAIMLLVHDGKFHYEDRLGTIFPEFPAYGKDITIRNLLNHTSGLPDYSEIMEQQEKNGGPKWTPEHQIQDDEVLGFWKLSRWENLRLARAGNTATRVMSCWA